MRFPIELFSFPAFLGLIAATAAAQSVVSGPSTSLPVKQDASPALGSIAPGKSSGTSHVRTSHRIDPTKSAAEDSVLQTAAAAPVSLALLSGFDGLGASTPNFLPEASPPNPVGAAGATQYFQAVNESFAVFDKSSGDMVYGPASINTIWSGFGGGCESNNDGDLMVGYDKIGGRWVLVQSSYTGGPPFLTCLAVSVGPDALGPYYRYAFSVPSRNDQARLGLWNDAYYVASSSWSGSGAFMGPQVCAIDRSKVMLGSPAQIVCFQLPDAYYALVPADLDGLRPPPDNAPAYILADDLNSYQQVLWRFRPNFSSPAGSTLTGPITISVSAFPLACSGCMPQPGISETVDPVGTLDAFRVSYRNFGDHEALYAAQGAGTPTGIRWYEIHDPGGSPLVAQQGTYAPDATFRLVPGMAADHTGNIAIGYGVAGTDTFPGIRTAGRLATDPAGVLRKESVIAEGGGARTGGVRLSDYGSMVVDPDDCTLWHTQQYQPSSGAFNWNTRISSLRFPECASPGVMLSPALGSQLGSSAVFTWSPGVNIYLFYIYIGTAPGRFNLLNRDLGTGTSVTANNLSSNDGFIYVRLHSYVNDKYEYFDYKYKGVQSVPARMTTPAPGSRIAGGSATFTWTPGVAGELYYLYIGTRQGAFDLYNQKQDLKTSATVSGLPTNGSTIYVRLWTFIHHDSYYEDYTYTTGP